MQKINARTVETVTHTHTVVLDNKRVGAHCMRPNTKTYNKLTSNIVGVDNHGDQKNCINKVLNKR